MPCQVSWCASVTRAQIIILIIIRISSSLHCAQERNMSSDLSHRETHPTLEISLAAQTSVTENNTRPSSSVTQQRPRATRNSPDPRNQTRSTDLRHATSQVRDQHPQSPRAGETKNTRNGRRSSRPQKTIQDSRNQPQRQKRRESILGRVTVSSRTLPEEQPQHRILARTSHWAPA